MDSRKKSITTYLLSLPTTPPYTSSTKNHPFLVSAADGTLSNSLLSLWLSQDRIYAAQAYPRFIGALISHIPFGYPTTRTDHSKQILKTLVYALENVVREVDFFDDTAQRWSLDLDRWKERKGTKDYIAEMARVAGTGRIEEGLLFLWAMEKVYLDAWSNIHESLTKRATDQNLKDGGSPLAALAANWSSPDFKVFVNDLTILVDSIYQELGEEAWSVALNVWERTIELEEGFWPKIDEETILLI